MPSPSFAEALRKRRDAALETQPARVSSRKPAANLHRSLPSADVVIVGGGNAALCAAISARTAGAEVLVLERAPEFDRGGNSKYTRNLRCIRDGLYEEDEFIDDIRGVSDPGMNEDLNRLLIRRSRELPTWMERHGVRWQPELRGTIQLGRTNRFFLGGGKALLNVYYARAHALGVNVAYEALVTGVEAVERGVSITVENCGERADILAKSVVIASGGFEANFQWLETHLGEGARRYAVRGSRFNDGALIGSLHEGGATSRGVPGRAHAVAVDERCPRFDAGIVSRVDSIPFGIVVDNTGRRFADEGQDIWPKRYASWGQLVADQPDQTAFSVFESNYRASFIPPCYPPVEADTVGELALKLGLDPVSLEATVAAFNAAAPDTRVSDVSRLDGRSTRGLTPPKSNWASPLQAPPFCAYPLKPGITFTYFSLGINERAQVLGRDEHPIAGIYGAGEAIAGNFLSKGYLAGFGMTIGSVFGRIAGEEAAAHARR
jgi:tricarballylate dehydrogenase